MNDKEFELKINEHDQKLAEFYQKLEMDKKQSRVWGFQIAFWVCISTTAILTIGFKFF